MPGAITYRNMDATHSHVEPAVPGPDDIAIVGFSFKLPQGVDDDAGFWDMLQNRRNMKTGWPESRINIDSFLNNKHHKVCHDYSLHSQAMKLMTVIVPRPGSTLHKR